MTVGEWGMFVVVAAVALVGAIALGEWALGDDDDHDSISR
jgi:hypothetical protein